METKIQNFKKEIRDGGILKNKNIKNF